MLPSHAASAAIATGAAGAGAPKPWSLADMARSGRAGDRNDVSAASRFDVASLSSSRTDVSGLDTPIAVTVTPTASDGFEVEVDGDGDGDDGAVAGLADGRDSAPSLPPPPNTRKSIRLPGVAEVPGDDPDDPVIDPPRPALPRQQSGIAAMFGAPAALGPQPHGVNAQPDAWATTSLRSSNGVGGAMRTLLGSRRRIAIIVGALALSVGVIVLATRGGNEAPPAAAPDKETHEPRGDEHEVMQPGTDDPTPSIESGTLDHPAVQPSAHEGDHEGAVGSEEPADSLPDATDAHAATTKPGAATTTTTKPAITTTKPAVAPTNKPAPTEKPAATHTSPAMTKPAVTKPAVTKPATTKPAATKRPPAKHSPAKHPPTKKPSWDPNQLFPKKK